MASVQMQKAKANGKKKELPDVIEQLEASLKAMKEGRYRKA